MIVAGMQPGYGTQLSAQSAHKYRVVNMCGRIVAAEARVAAGPLHGREQRLSVAAHQLLNGGYV